MQEKHDVAVIQAGQSRLNGATVCLTVSQTLDSKLSLGRRECDVIQS